MKNKILIIDDDKDFVDILKHNIEKRGYETSCAYNGMDGVKKARLERPDLIILDIMLPEVDGYSVSRLLKFDMKYKNTPIIIFSASRGDVSSLSCEVGADAYLAKSADAEELFEKIESLLKEAPLRKLGIRIAQPPAPFSGKVVEIRDSTIEDLRSRIKKLTAINEASYDINRSLEIDVCIKKLVEKTSSILAAEISSIMLLDKKENELVLKLAKGIKEEVVKNVKIRLGEGVAGMVAKEARPLLVEDVKKHPELKTRDSRSYKTDSFISVPLVVGTEVLGVVNVTDKIDKTSFTKEDLDVLMSIATNAAASIKNSTLYEELKRLSSVKSDFITTLSHELKGPLFNVRGAIGILLKDSYNMLNEEQARFLSIAKDNIERLLRLIDDLLDIAKLESGSMTMRRDRFDISNLVRFVAASFRAALDNKSINFILNAPADENIIWGDADRVEQVLNNLLSNAVKFSPAGGRMELLLEDAGDNVRLIVSDNGPGIPKEYIPKIFDKFSAISIKRDSIVKGTGLGLSITKDIVAMHKGSIWVESEKGKGCKFFVELPKDLRKR